MAAEHQLPTIELTDPRALRALAHPLRLSLLGLLRREGPLTATQAAVHVDASPSNCSFHLRHLAKHGLVEAAPGGRGRERPWRATAFFTSWPNAPLDPDLAAAANLLSAVVVERLFERVLRWVEAKPSDPTEWQEAASFGDALLYLTAEELDAYGEDVRALQARYGDRTASPEARPAGARRVAVIHFAFPDDGAP